MSTRWALRGTQIRDDDGRGQHVATYMRSREDGLLLAAAPELLHMLNSACDHLDELHEALYRDTSRLAAGVRARLLELGLTAAPLECTCRSHFERTGEHADGCPLATRKDRET